MQEVKKPNLPRKEDALRLKRKKKSFKQKAAVAASPFFRTRVAEVAVQPKSGRGSMD